MEDGDYSVTPKQTKFVRDLQKQLHLTDAALDHHCIEVYGLRFDQLDRGLCSSLIDRLTSWDAVPADLQRFMGQLDLFPQ